MRIHILIFLLICTTGSGQVFADTNNLPHPLSMLSSAQIISGPRLSSASIANKPLVITFFASWCPPCRHEFEQLNALKHHSDAQNVNIIAINVFEDDFGKKPARMQRFLGLTKPEFSVIKGNAEMRKAFGDITRIPTLIVYGKQGGESWRFIHKRGAKKMSAELDEIVSALQKAGN